MDNNFEELYSKIFNENSNEIELLRIEAKKEKNKNLFIFFGILLVIIFAYFMSFFYTTSIFLLVLIHFIYLGFFIYAFFKFSNNPKYKQYKDKYKYQIIKSIIQYFNENINYSPYQGIKSIVYNEGDFESYDRYNSDDLISGVLENNCKFEMGNVLTENRYTDSDGHVHYSTIFSGIFAKIETPKPFSAQLYLRNDVNDKGFLSRVFSTQRSFDNLRVELDSQEFEEMFDTYCTDKIIAMQLLTADIMQLLTEFKKNLKIDYELTIKNNNIYLRYRVGKMFEIESLSKSALDKDTLYKYYKILDFTFTLTNKLINLIKNTEYDN